MSVPLVKTPDTGYLVTLSTNGYGDPSVLAENKIACAFFQQYNTQDAANQQLVQSDAYAYLDINDAFIKNLGYKLQGMYFRIAPFGTNQWYIITAVQVAQRKLLTNEVNNVLINLQITAPPIGVS